MQKLKNQKELRNTKAKKEPSTFQLRLFTQYLSNEIDPSQGCSEELTQMSQDFPILLNGFHLNIVHTIEKGPKSPLGNVTYFKRKVMYITKFKS